MKKIIIILIILMPLLTKAQYGIEVLTNPSQTAYVFLGTLPISDGGNFQKLKVDVLGGEWESGSNGETTFYIANREGLKIHQVTMASNIASRYSLHTYTHPSGAVDFYLVTNNYAAMAVKSCILGQDATHLITNTITFTPPANVTEILPLTIVPVLITDYSGSIGMNTFNPDPNYILSVNGSIRAKEIKVETGWADYVFNKDYSLKSLNEVENYIKKNNHLPDVPSASEVASQGIKIGETEALMLRKIEELTLYLIAKDKKDKSQQNKLKFQQLRINNQQKQLNRLNQQIDQLQRRLN